ncbi:hypothetical protein ABKN59_006859 [Abortiporus biennis]
MDRYLCRPGAPQFPDRVCIDYRLSSTLVPRRIDSVLTLTTSLKTICALHLALGRELSEFSSILLYTIEQLDQEGKALPSRLAYLAFVLSIQFHFWSIKSRY